jgi:hypothetical protein
MVDVTALFGVLAMLFGAVAVHWGYRRRRYDGVVAGTPRRDVADVEEPGFVRVEGEVTSVADGESPVSAPFSGESCVVAGWRVADWDERGDAESWRRVGEGYESVAFELDDGTGVVRVEAGSGANDGRYDDPGGFANSVVVENVNVDLGRFRREHQVAPGEERPSEVRTFETGNRVLPEQAGSVTNAVDVGAAHGERRYREATIERGDSVVVLGYANPTSDGGPASGGSDAVLRPAEDGEFVLSVRSGEQLQDLTRWWWPAIVVGLGLFCWGAFSVYAAVPFPFA